MVRVGVVSDVRRGYRIASVDFVMRSEEIKQRFRTVFSVAVFKNAVATASRDFGRFDLIEVFYHD